MTLHAVDLGGAAPAILAVHIIAGTAGAFSGAAALYFGKGTQPHRMVGNVFLVSMLIMAAAAAYLAVLIRDVTVFGAIFAIYLVATSWVTIRRKEGSIGRFEVGALFFAMGIAATELSFGLAAATSATGRIMGYSPAPYFVLASIAALAAAFDVKVIRSGGIAGAPRIARHLWRMCFALFIALVSFVGQGLRTILPVFPYILLLALVPLLVMTYWLIRVRLTKWYKRYAAEPQQALS